jgi:Carboxypeptidase regulatory-like domain/TonB-dependent Receptor Plug Domain
MTFLRSFRRGILTFPILVTLICLVAIRPAGAQSFYGTIVGVVTDASGAVVPGATVKATQTETNETRTGATNDAGVYTLSTVPAGTYVVSFSKSGFDLFEARGIDLTINTTVRVDAKLTVGGQPLTINVRSNSAELQTDRAGLLPGVTPPNPGFAGSGGTNNPARAMIINANGTSASGTNVGIDGVSATNPWVQFYSTAVPSTEAIETVNVVTASSSADQGTVNGAAIRVQIKSGTNSLHGSAYWRSSF